MEHLAEKISKYAHRDLKIYIITIDGWRGNSGKSILGIYSDLETAKKSFHDFFDFYQRLYHSQAERMNMMNIFKQNLKLDILEFPVKNGKLELTGDKLYPLFDTSNLIHQTNKIASIDVYYFNDYLARAYPIFPD